MSLDIRELTVAEFYMAAPHLVDIYVTAMGYDTALIPSRIKAWRLNSRNQDFHAFVAVVDRRVVGVAYGFQGNPHQWWFNQVYHGVRQHYGHNSPEVKMMRHYFEVSEIHVAPEFQGRGIGARLLRALLAAASSPHVLLSTPEVAGEANSAFHLYRAHGFSDLLRYFLFRGDSRPFAVLQRQLPHT